jgi:hypothetical protein
MDMDKGHRRLVFGEDGRKLKRRSLGKGDWTFTHLFCSLRVNYFLAWGPQIVIYILCSTPRLFSPILFPHEL